MQKQKLTPEDIKLLDYFAGQALNALILKPQPGNPQEYNIVKDAYHFADLMISEREFILTNRIQNLERSVAPDAR